MKSRIVITVILLTNLFSMGAFAQEDGPPSHVSFATISGNVLLVPPAAPVPHVLLSFTTADGHRNMTVTDDYGTYKILVPPAQYCVTAYVFKTGAVIPLYKAQQLRCVEMKENDNLRWDVTLVSPKDLSVFVTSPAKATSPTKKP